jgi:dTDP-4-amino-4,6-dideoxygalactose transaminase
VEAGYKCNMTDLSAAIGLIELERYDNDTLVKRKYICDLYSQLLKQFSWAELPLQQNNDATSCYHLYPLRIKNCDEQSRDRIIQSIFNQDISVNVHFIPLPMLSFYKNLGYDIANYPNTYDLYSKEISLPVFYDLTDDQIKEVVKAVSIAVEEELVNKVG